MRSIYRISNDIKWNETHWTNNIIVINGKFLWVSLEFAMLSSNRLRFLITNSKHWKQLLHVIVLKINKLCIFFCALICAIECYMAMNFDVTKMDAINQNANYSGLRFHFKLAHKIQIQNYYNHHNIPMWWHMASNFIIHFSNHKPFICINCWP